MASLGGASAHNAERDLHRWVRTGLAHDLEIYTIWLELQTPNSRDTELVPVPVLMPWLIVHALWRAGRWKTSMLGPDASVLGKFWDHAQSQPWAREHPHLQAGLDLNLTVPMVLHTDGAEVYTNCEFYIWSISSLLPTRGHVLDDKFQIFKIPHACMRRKTIKDQVMRSVAAFFAWSFDVLASGRPPAHGFYGEPWKRNSIMQKLYDKGDPLFGPWHCIFSGMKSDLKARKEINFFDRSYMHLNMCDACDAVQGFSTVMRDETLKKFLYLDVTKTAAWRNSACTHEKYMARSEIISPWAVVPGFRKELVYWDYMHIAFLGIHRDLCAGACLTLLLRGRLKGVSADLQLRGLWLSFREWCKAHGKGAPTGDLSMRLIGRTKGQCLSRIAQLLQGDNYQMDGVIPVVILQFDVTSND